MKVFERLNPRNWFKSSRLAQSTDQGIRARFDTQFTTDDNARHWAMADATSIDAGAQWQVRRTLRMRSRYEYHNNSFYMGIADTIGNYVIGTGPRLQMMTRDKVLNAAIEAIWTAWAKEIRLSRTLKSMRVARLVNGESFSILRNNPNLDNAVKLDVFQIEADQVSSPLFGIYPSAYPDQYFDGVVLDRYGRPREYHVLKQHPGAFGAYLTLGTEFDRYPARYMLHYYKEIRPGQQRGIPEALPALPLFANLRRFGLATVAAAETAADFAVMMESDAPADDEPTDTRPSGSSAPPTPFDVMSIEKRMGVFLPKGYKPSQLKAEHPTTTYEMYVNAVLTEICRCLNLPLIFGSLDARLANMASAYIVMQAFTRSIEVDRSECDLLLDRTLDEFLTEAIRVPGLIQSDLPEEFPHSWRWPSIGNHADPSKVATAQEAALANGTTSIAKICAANGDDWEEVQESAAKSYGMTVPQYQQALREKLFAPKGMPGSQGAPVTNPASVDETPADESAAEEVENDTAAGAVHNRLR